MGTRQCRFHCRAGAVTAALLLLLHEAYIRLDRIFRTSRSRQDKYLESSVHPMSHVQIRQIVNMQIAAGQDPFSQSGLSLSLGCVYA